MRTSIAPPLARSTLETRSPNVTYPPVLPKTSPPATLAVARVTAMRVTIAALTLALQGNHPWEPYYNDLTDFKIRRHDGRYDHGHRGSREYDSDSDVRRAPRVYDYPDFEA